MTLQKKVSIKVNADASKATSEFAKLGKSTGQAKRSADELGRSLVDVGGSKLTVSDLATGFMGLKSAIESSVQAVQGAVRALDEFSDSSLSGQNILKNQKMSIDGLRNATGGLVKDLDLVRLSNEALQLEVADSAAELEMLAEAAVRAGAASGKTAVESIEAMTLAIGRNSTARLDNIGVIITQREAEEEYAKTLGISADSMTDQQKAAAANVIMKRKIIEAGRKAQVVEEGLAVSVQKIKTAYENEWDALKRGEGQYLQMMKVQYGLASSYEVARRATVNFTGDLVIATRQMQRAQEAAQQLAKTMKDSLAAANQKLVEDLTKVQIHEIDKELAFIRGRNGFRERENELLAERANLEIGIAKAAGDSAKVLQLTNEEEIRQLGAINAGLKDEAKSRKEIDRFARERAAFQKELESSRMDQNFRAIDRGEQAQRSTFAEQLREAQQAQMMDRQRELIEQANEERRQQRHEAELARMEEWNAHRDAMIEQEMKRAEAEAKMANLAASSLANASMAAMKAEGNKAKAFLRSLRDMGASYAIQNMIVGITDLTKANSLAAGIYTAPLAAPYYASAAAAFTNAAIVGGLAGVAAVGVRGMSSGGRSVAGGYGADAFGGGMGGGGYGGSANGPANGPPPNTTGIPGSPGDGTRRRQAGAQQPSPKGGTVVNNNTINATVLGGTKEQVGHALASLIKDSERSAGAFG